MDRRARTKIFGLRRQPICITSSYSNYGGSALSNYGDGTFCHIALPAWRTLPCAPVCRIPQDRAKRFTSEHCVPQELLIEYCRVADVAVFDAPVAETIAGQIGKAVKPGKPEQAATKNSALSP
ncbi:hypothetical protein NKJ70_04035 [Mesorhizobium sp. M0092]|uniref:hypothetical protein n=1 Tax=unclassified Mesorhizobium TaxID=325217 RepID=UPI0033383F83